jgi:D-alanyl-D-alanine carboxypeptidase
MLAALCFRHPLRSSKAAAASLCLLAACAALSAPAAAAPRYAAMAIDANTGAVLHNQAGDEPRYPASLTKMMTL